MSISTLSFIALSFSLVGYRSPVSGSCSNPKVSEEVLRLAVEGAAQALASARVL